MKHMVSQYMPPENEVPRLENSRFAPVYSSVPSGKLEYQVKANELCALSQTLLSNLRFVSLINIVSISFN